MAFLKKIFTSRDGEDRASLSKRVQMMPQDPQARQKLGLFLLRQGEVVEGIDQLARSAVLYEKSGFASKALAVLRHMIKHDPTNLELLRWLIRMLAQQGQQGDAQNELTKIAGGSVRFPTEEQKIEFFRAAAEQLKNNPLPPLLIADILISQRKYYEAMNELEKAAPYVVPFGMVADYAKRMNNVVGHCGDKTELLETMAFLWLRAGRNEDALSLLSRTAGVVRRGGDVRGAEEVDRVAAAIREGRGGELTGVLSVSDAARLLAEPAKAAPAAPAPERPAAGGSVPRPAAPAPESRAAGESVPRPAAPAPESPAAGGNVPRSASPAPESPAAGGSVPRSASPASVHPQTSARNAEDERAVQNVVEQLQAKVNEEIGDKDPEARYNLGIAYKEMGLLEEALDEFRIARRRRSLFLGASCLMAETYAERGDVAAAIAALDEVLSADGVTVTEIRDIRYQKALMLQRDGQEEAAGALFAELYAQYPDYRDVRARVERRGS